MRFAWQYYYHYLKLLWCRKDALLYLGLVLFIRLAYILNEPQDGAQALAFLLVLAALSSFIFGTMNAGILYYIAAPNFINLPLLKRNFARVLLIFWLSNLAMLHLVFLPEALDFWQRDPLWAMFLFLLTAVPLFVVVATQVFHRNAFLALIWGFPPAIILFPSTLFSAYTAAAALVIAVVCYRYLSNPDSLTALARRNLALNSCSSPGGLGALFTRFRDQKIDQLLSPAPGKVPFMKRYTALLWLFLAEKRLSDLVIFALLLIGICTPLFYAVTTQVRAFISCGLIVILVITISVRTAYFNFFPGVLPLSRQRLRVFHWHCDLICATLVALVTMIIFGLVEAVTGDFFSAVAWQQIVVLALLPFFLIPLGRMAGILLAFSSRFPLWHPASLGAIVISFVFFALYVLLLVALPHWPRLAWDSGLILSVLSALLWLLWAVALSFFYTHWDFRRSYRFLWLS